MAIRNIRVEEDQILRKTSKEVTEIDDKIIELLDDMRETMDEANGVGLAAVQVGVLKRIFIACFDGEEVTECINPVVTKMDGHQVGTEGCLSIPNTPFAYRKRPMEVTLEYTDREGVRYEVELDGFGAVVCMHEFDHLDGKLYIDDTMTDEEVAEYKKEFGDFEEDEDEVVAE